MLNVDELSNEQIRLELTSRGFNTGPVVDGTRAVYANKLRRILHQQMAGGDADPKPGAPPVWEVGGVVDGSSKRERTVRSPQRPPLIALGAAAVLEEPPGKHMLPHSSLTPPKAMRYSRKPPEMPESLSLRTSPKTTYTSRKPPLITKSVLSEVTRGPVKVSSAYPIPARRPNVYRTTPTTRFIASYISKGEREGEESDDDFRGEESSRVLTPNQSVDQSYSTRYGSELGRIAFENSYDARNVVGAKVLTNGALSYTKPTSKRSYGRICFAVSVVSLISVFIFFVVQNFAALEQGEANREEL